MTDEAYVAAALAGDITPDAQVIVERRVIGCQRLTGVLPAALKASDPARYWRWLRGTVRAIVRPRLPPIDAINLGRSNS
jgi:hypothetical protein